MAAPWAVVPAAAGSAAGNGYENTTLSGVQLTDIMGERTVLVRASVTIEGIPHTVELPVTFGKGPLSQFRVIPFDQYLWAEHQPVSNGANAEAGSFPVAMACGSSLTPAELRTLPDGYHAATNLPSKEQLGMVMGEFGNGGWVAAGWPNTLWSGELHNGGETALSVGSFGFSLYAPVDQRAFPVVCLR